MFTHYVPFLLSFQHRAGVRPYTSCYHFAESCVFSKQSPPLILCHLLRFKKKVLLIPKLRRQFAEFLQHDSLYAFVHLHESTCVGLSTVFFCNRKDLQKFLVISWTIFYFFRNPITKKINRKIAVTKNNPLIESFRFYLRGRFTLH